MSENQVNIPESELGGFGSVGFDRRLPRLPLGLQPVSLVALTYHQGTGGNGILVSVLLEGREAEGPKGWRIQLGGKFPKYGKRDTKEVTAAIEGLPLTDPRAMALDTPDALKIIRNPTAFKGRRFLVNVTESGRSDVKTGIPYLDHRPMAHESGAAPVVATTPTAPAADPTPPPPPASAAPADDGGPWFDFKASDPRAGRRQYNRAGAQRDKP